MEAAASSEALVYSYQTARLYIPEGVGLIFICPNYVFKCMCMTYLIAGLLPGHLALLVSIRNVLLSYERHNDALAATSLHFRLLGSCVVLSTVTSDIVLTGIS